MTNEKKSYDYLKGYEDGINYGLRHIFGPYVDKTNQIPNEELKKIEVYLNKKLTQFYSSKKYEIHGINTLSNRIDFAKNTINNIFRALSDYVNEVKERPIIL